MRVIPLAVARATSIKFKIDWNAKWLKWMEMEWFKSRSVHLKFKEYIPLCHSSKTYLPDSDSLVILIRVIIIQRLYLLLTLPLNVTTSEATYLCIVTMWKRAEWKRFAHLHAYQSEMGTKQSNERTREQKKKNASEEKKNHGIPSCLRVSHHRCTDSLHTK